ncbi:oocyte zinc finger protein XlCOF28-like isoform X2 [Patiria miniata]|uniref:C2H2-type domain-containing protein n=1 Tax=Patiria miniata TaxID=46514 RepID=A0A914BKW3_PATMI|nr:oocyte zinc finger protein XlCOF28-like isoform X2 [Patiria miniata]XP_038076751.1 oocyte zinc finger protein XlCOF28-like isoform X2 [Patiria miniata]
MSEKQPANGEEQPGSGEKQPANGEKSKKTSGKKRPREKVKCALCDFTSFPGYAMKRHMRIHTGEKPFMCAMCDQSFTQKSSLKEHLWKHSVLHSRHKCPHCDALFNLLADVQSHTIYMHSKVIENLACSFCEAVFDDRYSLLQHEKTHDDMYRYQCLECAFSSKFKDKLIIHMSVHNKHTPLRCNACKNTYKGKAGLLSHLFQMHGINMFGDLSDERAAAAANAAPKKLTNQQELEEQYQIVDEHGNTLELTEADAEAIRNAMQRSSGDETLQIIQNEEGTMTVTVVTVAPNMDETLQDISQNIELSVSGEGMDEGTVSQEADMEVETSTNQA